jgi:hypothetical protein
VLGEGVGGGPHLSYFILKLPQTVELFWGESGGRRKREKKYLFPKITNAPSGFYRD